MRRRWRLWAMLGLVAAVALVAGAAALIPSSTYMITPGETKDLNTQVQVAGHRPPTAGRLLMVAVFLQRASLLDTWLYRGSPYVEMQSIQQVTGGMSMPSYMQLNVQAMDQSQQVAAVAAESYLGLPARETGHGVLVAGVAPGLPAARSLAPGEVIQAMNGQPVATALQLIDLMNHTHIGQALTLTVQDHGRIRKISLHTASDPYQKGRSIIGIMPVTYQRGYRLPVPVRVHLGSISGPSAGLMMALEVVDQIRPLPIGKGRIIAGTGTIDPMGYVGPIGGVRMKVITASHSGATLFFSPIANYPAAAAQVRRLHLPLTVVPIATLADAVSYLRHHPA